MAQREQVIQNTFNDGMFQDLPEAISPKTSYQFARNAVISDRDSIASTISNEEANEFVASLGEAAVGYVFVESLNSSIILTKSDSIYIFDHDKEELKFVMSAGEFGCKWGFNECEWIDPEYKFMQPCDELWLYFSSNCIYYRVNISEMLNSERKASLKNSITDGSRLKTNCDLSCEYFKLFHCVCTPKITADVNDLAGHKLENGVYKFAIQLESKDGATTNWSEVSQPIYVGSESDQPGEISTSSINIHLTGLDCRYDVVNIAVINGYNSAEVVSSIGYSTDGVTFTYYGQTGRSIDIGEIIVKTKKYLRGRSLEQKDSRLYLYNIRQEKNPDMQRRVFDSARLRFMTIETDTRTAERNNIKSLQRGEYYMFGVVYKYCDGTHSPVFLLYPHQTASQVSPVAAAGEMTCTDCKVEEFSRPRGNNRTGEDKSGGGCSGGGCGAGGASTTPRSQDYPSSQKDYLDEWETVISDYENSARCNDCHPPICCTEDEDGNVVAVVAPGSEENCIGCKEDEEAIAADVPDTESIFADQTDNLTEWGYDGNNRPNNNTILGTAKALLRMIKDAEVIKRKKPEWNFNTKIGSSSSNDEEILTNNVDSTIPPSSPSNTQSGDGVGADNISNTFGSEGDTPDSELPAQSRFVPKPDQMPIESVPINSSVTWGDEYHNIKGQSDLDNKYKIVEYWSPIPKETIHIYPDTVGCDGELIYGSYANKNVALFGTPTIAQSPHFRPTGKGVPQRGDPAKDPWHMAVIRHLGIEVTGVPLPENDEDWFPKPLCPNEPYRIVMVERDQINSVVQANAFATHTFKGQSGGETFNFPRHGLCSKDKIDYHVLNGGSHEGTDGDNVYNLYSLDLGTRSVGLSATKIHKNAIVRGAGWRYNLYAKGKEPIDRLNGNRVDQRGATQFINANLIEPQHSEYSVSGIGYVGANQKHVVITGISNPCTTAYREGSVFTEISGSLGETDDASFKTDTLIHEAPIFKAHGWNVSLRRDINDQYGHVVGMKFIDTGVRANGRRTATQGFTGDIYIGPYSWVKKGYVSDKVGDTFATPQRPRTVCDSSDDLLLQNLDINHYPTRLPKSADYADARNWAGGYEEMHSLEVAIDNPPPKHDFYYPKTVKTLIVTFLESRHNPWRRATGLGDQRDAGLAYYPRLKGMFLSSHEGRERPWEESFLNRFYYRLDQPSPAQLLRKAILRNMVELILPMLGLVELAEKQLPTDITGYIFVLPGLVAYWKLMRDVILREDYLNKMVGIQDCKTDSEGGEPDNYIVNFEDNYHLINPQYQVNTTENYYKTPELNYNTCVCDACVDTETTNEIYVSNKQTAGSQIDAYKMFQSIPYNQIGGDKGKLRKLFKWNGQFYAHTTEGIFLIKTQAINTPPSDAGLIRLTGSAHILDPVALFEGVPEGMMGIQDPNASILTPFGYFFVDREAKRVYKFDGGRPEEISSVGMYNFFKENLDFCEIGDCHDEKNEGSTYYSMGWDNRFNRLLLTKKSQNRKESFTMSYYPALGKGSKGVWGSFHDYIPQFYMWDRNNLFTVTGGDIYKQNIKHKYQRIYGNIVPFEVQFTANIEDYEWFTYTNNLMHTDAEDTSNNIKGIDLTFDKIAAWNYSQGTGTLYFRPFNDNKEDIKDASELIEEKNKTVPYREVRRKYAFNELYDLRVPGCGDKPMLLDNDCQWYPKINESLFDCSVRSNSNFINKTIQDDHLSYRLTYGGASDSIRLRLIDFKTFYSRNIM